MLSTKLMAAVGVLTLALSTSAAMCCPFCAAPEQTLTEQLGQSDAAVLVQWSSGTPADREKETVGETSYQIVEIMRQPGNELSKGATIKLDRYRPGKSGDLFLLMGSNTDGINWASPLEVSETSFNYLKQAPGKEVPSLKRLSYFLKFLEYSDPLIANDAYAEFAGAPYQEIAPLAEAVDPAKVRKWISNPQTVPTRLGFYGLLLGICGKEEDAEFLKQEILKPVEGYRLGIDGLMAGYLLLTRDEGVTVLEDSKLKDATIPFSETYAAMQALRFVWQYGEDRVPKQRLREAMRILLDRPEVADLVITDLARWEDWGVMDRLMEMYDSPSFNNSQTKRSIVRYLLVMSKKKDVGAEHASDVAAAKTNLAALKEKDPTTVKQAEKFFFLN
jgi:hypothetical protein